jgi:hypothetical protein
MNFKFSIALLLVAVSSAYAQGDRGSITGTVTDSSGAVVANAPIEARSTETSATYQAASTGTGNYTVAQIPAGTYEISVTLPGFKKFIRQGLTVQVAQTVRVDIVLEVGASTESVTVTADAALLKTESGELNHNINTNDLNNLPVLGIGAGSAGIRNPYSSLQLIPGTDWHPDSSVRINGFPSNTQAMRVEGQDSTSGISSSVQSSTQPSVEAIQEFAVQTSNFAAEFGQAGGGLFNVTMRSGTNQFHGSGYDYFVNEALNAGVPFTNNGQGGLLRPRVRRNDYGFSLGGPVELPKIYNGRDKTFFFFNFEQYRETVITNTIPTTVPTALMRSGDFSQALTKKNLGTDALGRPILENTLYDPTTNRIVNGLAERDPFAGNVIPLSQQDAVALKMQALIPLPNQPGLINNYLTTYKNPKVSTIPSIKIDQMLSSSSKLSGYWSETTVTVPNNNAFTYPITTAVGTDNALQTMRLNFDQTLSPTLLLHVGAGMIYGHNNGIAQAFDPTTLGFKGANTNLFPSIQSISAAQGGSANLGIGTQTNLIYTKPSFTVSMTWVKNNHTYKAGGEVITQGYQTSSRSYSSPWMVFNAKETGLPSLNGITLSGSVGFPYASFLMGRVDSGYLSVPSTTRLGNHAISGFVQDTWKVTRRLTLDYGLRYDFQTYLREHDGEMSNVSLSTPNPSAGGLPGAIIFEGYGPGRCQCSFAKNYPWAFGPRLGVAWQVHPKWAVRAGIGVAYTRNESNNGKNNNAGSVNPYAAASYGDPAFQMQDGIPYKVSFPNFNPGQLPLPGALSNPTNTLDQNAGRPARTVQWSLGIQREFGSNLLVEAAYVGNRGVWWQANTLIAPNALTSQILAAHGLSFNNPTDLKLLATPLNQLPAGSPFAVPPYPGFPLGSTVAQALRPYPEYTTLVNSWNPDGNTWYDSLQTKVTKRLSHGLDVNASFTWSKQLDIGAEQDFGYFTFVTAAINDVTNRQNNKYLSAFDQPYLFVLSSHYTTPKLNINRVLATVARDWELGGVLRYGSGFPIQVPTATSGLATYTFQNTYVNRVPGAPLFTQDLNCHCFDPNSNFVLNKNAWANPVAGQFGTAAAYYNDYRYQRRPQENVSIARNFRIRERMTFQLRAEFTNIFNRTYPNNPTFGNAFATQTINAAGQTTGGFGSILANTTTGTVFMPPRQGQLVARFQF